MAKSNKAPAGPASSHWTRSTRETVESIAIAFAMAFLFKTFEAEAFVIPTGSMAPTLMGRHKDVECPECGFQYSASGSEEADRNGNIKPGDQDQVIKCVCPLCRFPMSVDPKDPHNRGRDAHPSYNGDRIWVSKVPYEMADPRRWDVAVFRYPEEAETYYIKRLVGLPNETVRIYHGDLYTKAVGTDDFVIQRKPPDKIRAMAQIVHDNDYVSDMLLENHWPLWWQPWSDEKASGAWQPSDDTRSYQTDGSADGETWVRYQHVVPSDVDWDELLDGRWSAGKHPRPQLITDFYAFNTRVVRRERGFPPSALGLHWVGDLILDCQLEVQSPQGIALLDLVQGGRHFRCEIDVATGKTELTIPGLDGWRREAQTAIRGKGKHNVMFANVDRHLTLWIDGQVVAFDQPTEYQALDNDRPVSTQTDAGDLAPLGIGSRGAALKVDHLRVLRDIYYIADDTNDGRVITDYRPGPDCPAYLDTQQLADFLSTPRRWQRPQVGNIFDTRQAVEFPLAEDQFFMLGDNSPASSDARLWHSQHYVERDLLVGKALFVYWPHPLNLFIPFTDYSIPIVPNVGKMGLIH